MVDYSLNKSKYEHTGQEQKKQQNLTRYTGSVLKVFAVSPTHSTATVVLKNGRHKVFSTSGIQMQEGDEVDFVITDADQNVYVKNFTTGDEDIAKPVYHKSEAVFIISVILLGCVTCGLYKLFSAQHDYLIGSTLLFTSGPLLICFIVFSQKHINAIGLAFQNKVLLTGVTAKNFKPVHVLS